MQMARDTEYDDLDCQAFQGWYSRTGHWVYETRADALRTWIERGIGGMPDAPVDAGQRLAQWVAEDQAPALIAKLREQRQGARQ